VPLRRATDDWLISGHISIYAASARRRFFAA